MPLESWLPIGFELPDGARCGRALYGKTHWQVVGTYGGGSALIAKRELISKWLISGLLEKGEMQAFSLGSETLHEISSGPSQMLAPLADCRSPYDKSEALAFAAALRETRKVDSSSSLRDCVYVERLSRLLPTYETDAQPNDEIVLGYWLSGGAYVSVRAFRKLRQMLSWLSAKDLRDVVETAGFSVAAIESSDVTQMDQRSSDTGDNDRAEPICSGSISTQTTSTAEPFKLPGRPDLEAFFNEHVIDILRDKVRYQALGVGFPSAIVLHGPPGCGKTFAVERLVEYLGWPTFQIDSSSIGSPYIHETSRKVAEIFDKASQIAPSVLVIDEMEAFLADRESGTGGSHHRIEEVAEFLRRIPDAVNNDVLIIAMTNRIEMIDTAILRRGRFDHVVRVNFASSAEVLDLLNNLMGALPKDENVDLGALAIMLAQRPLSDVAFVVREGARLAARSGANAVSQETLLAALRNAPSRTDDESRRRIGFA